MTVPIRSLMRIGAAIAITIACPALAADIPRLAGVLPCDARLGASWPSASAWMYPVGNRRDVMEPGGAEPGFGVSRQLEPARGHSRGHLGVDLVDGRGGDPVRAAAAGLVACAGVQRHGYGDYLVLAHRLEGGGLAYTVYAHLEHGTDRLPPGLPVAAGQTIGRVGSTGNATTPHLHFEVRVPADTTLRWERCPAVDPLEFVGARLPASRPDSVWSTPYLQWAEWLGIVPRGLAPDTTVDARLWGRMRAVLDRTAEVAGAPLGPPAPVDSAVAGVPPHASEPASWSRLIPWMAGVPAFACDVDLGRHAAACVARLGSPHPALDWGGLARRIATVRLDELCLALADAALARGARAAR